MQEFLLRAGCAPFVGALGVGFGQLVAMPISGRLVLLTYLLVRHGLQGLGAGAQGEQLLLCALARHQTTATAESAQAWQRALRLSAVLLRGLAERSPAHRFAWQGAHTRAWPDLALADVLYPSSSCSRLSGCAVEGPLASTAETCSAACSQSSTTPARRMLPCSPSSGCPASSAASSAQPWRRRARCLDAFMGLVPVLRPAQLGCSRW